MISWGDINVAAFHISRNILVKGDGADEDEKEELEVEEEQDGSGDVVSSRS
jgi:hypothetical protein